MGVAWRFMHERSMPAFTAAKEFEEKNGRVTGARILTNTSSLGALSRLSYSRLLPKPDSNRHIPRDRRSNPILTSSKKVLRRKPTGGPEAWASTWASAGFAPATISSIDQCSTLELRSNSESHCRKN